MFSGPSYGRSAMWLEPGMRRRRGPRGIVAPLVAVVALLACAAAVVYVVFDPFAKDDRRESPSQFADAWSRGDNDAMHALIDPETARAYPLERFAATYRAPIARRPSRRCAPARCASAR